LGLCYTALEEQIHQEIKASLLQKISSCSERILMYSFSITFNNIRNTGLLADRAKQPRAGVVLAS